MEKNDASPEAITYVIMLSAMQVVLNCQLELKGTVYDQGRITNKVREAVNMLNLKNSSNRDLIWKTDEINAANIMRGIEIIGEQIAKSDGVVLHLLTNLTRKGIDLSRCVLKELSEEELAKLQKEKEQL
jgi:hypothetical protein